MLPFRLELLRGVRGSPGGYTRRDPRAGWGELRGSAGAQGTGGRLLQAATSGSAPPEGWAQLRGTGFCSSAHRFPGGLGGHGTLPDTGN